MDAIFEMLKAYIEQNGGEVPYADFIAQVSGPEQVNVANAARGRFQFRLTPGQDGKLVHLVSNLS